MELHSVIPNNPPALQASRSTPHMDINQLVNLRLAYEELERQVQRALNTQVGDNERLAEVQNEVLSYNQAVEQVRRANMIKI